MTMWKHTEGGPVSEGSKESKQKFCILTSMRMRLKRDRTNGSKFGSRNCAAFQKASVPKADEPVAKPFLTCTVSADFEAGKRSPQNTESLTAEEPRGKDECHNMTTSPARSSEKQEPETTWVLPANQATGCPQVNSFNCRGNITDTLGACNPVDAPSSSPLHPAPTLVKKVSGAREQTGDSDKKQSSFWQSRAAPESSSRPGACSSQCTRCRTASAHLGC